MLTSRLRGDDKPFTIITPAQSGGKRYSRSIFFIFFLLVFNTQPQEPSDVFQFHGRACSPIVLRCRTGDDTHSGHSFQYPLEGYKRRKWDAARGSFSPKDSFVETAEQTEHLIADSLHPLRNLICSNSLITLLS